MQPARQRPLPEALAACAKASDSSARVAIEIPNGKGKLVFPAAYRGRAHLDCVVNAMLEEATAIDREYGEIVRANYPDLREAGAVCRIEQQRLDQHMARAKTFDARAALLQKSFDANAAMVDEVRAALHNIDLSPLNDSGALMKSILAQISAPIERAKAQHREVVRLMQGIADSQKAMATVNSLRKVICA